MAARPPKENQGGIRITTKIIHKQTRGAGDIIDLTPDMNHLLDGLGLDEGTATVFNVGSTAGISTMEYEPGLVKDLDRVYDRLAPEKESYAHHQTWGDHNGFSHVRATLQGPSLVVPFQNGQLLLGTWQQVVLLEFDDRPRNRKIIVQFLGRE